MKRFILIAIALMSLVTLQNVYAADVVATWEHDHQNTDGYYIYWRESTASTWTFNKHIEDPNAEEMILMPEEYFKPDTEYSFVGIAHSNTFGDSPPSNIAKWTRPAGSFAWDVDRLPTIVLTAPSAPTPPSVTP